MNLREWFPKTTKELRKESVTRWFHKLRKKLFVLNSTYFGRLCHHQELHGTDLTGKDRHTGSEFYFRCRNFFMFRIGEGDWKV
jgi:hypothetical protein